MHCRIRCSALVVMAVVVWSWDASCVHCERTFTVHTDKSLIINIRLVASYWFLSLHPTFMMHSQKSQKLDFSLKIGYIGSFKFGCYCLQYVPASEPFDHA